MLWWAWLSCRSLPPAGAVDVAAVAINVSGRMPPACLQAVDDDGRPCVDAAAPIALSPAQAEALVAWLGDRGTWHGDEAKCTIPLHAFVWWDAAGAPVQQVAVSLLCDKVEAAPRVRTQPRSPGARGLSLEGKEAFRALCRDLGLPRCDIEHPDELGGL